jgi:hypothetical protein
VPLRRAQVHLFNVVIRLGNTGGFGIDDHDFAAFYDLFCAVPA